MTVVTDSALFCAALYAGLLALTFASRSRNHETALAAVACGLTVIWALALADPRVAASGALPALSMAPPVAWTILLSALVAPTLNARFDPRLRFIIMITPGVVALAVVWNDVLLALRSSGEVLAQSQIAGREAMAVFGLLLVENLFRNTAVRRQWNIVPLCIGLGGLFAYQLFLYSDALLFGWVSRLFTAALPAVSCLIAPFLALTLMRNRGWKISIQLSQRVVLHTLTLIASGVFLLAIVIVADLLRISGGDEWTRVLQVAGLFGSILMLASVVLSGTIKARLKYLIVRHFFAQRYDYRIEWMNFIDLLSTRGVGEDLKRRAIEGIANVVDAPAGALWLRDGIRGDGDFIPVSLWNMRLPTGTAEPADSTFVEGFRGGRWIQEFYPGRAYPSLGECWLAVPLAAENRLIGFITLAHARVPTELNWESFELLRALARQAASYIAEERLAQQLRDSQRLQDYAKRFAFVAHDIKNLAAQLRMVALNAQRHGDDPAFRADAFETIRNSVARMNDLLKQLRAKQVAEEAAVAAIDAVPVIRRVLDARGAELARIRCAFECGGAWVVVDPERLASVVKLLLDNAIEASPESADIMLGLRCRDGKLVLEIADQGPGMDVEFIHGELFRPFRSTKSDGYGIGAYQTRELLRMVGGDLEVVSAPDAGTTMRVILPLAKEGAVSSAA